MQEITALLALADRDLKACQTPNLVSDWRFNIAYNAALQSATAALAAAGYRVERANHHYRTLQSLEFTIGLDENRIRVLDLFRKKRNLADYERAEIVTDAELSRMIELAAKLRRTVETWIRTHHPDLLA
ncbi:MAG TPA: hypothetical protein PKJ41_00530 [Bryobacteraceae bacterium]|nr:hypothetical protein [Bryobacteraceae bacterium]HPT25295.1 hypothetical protein [Bryobacteraceae bacterium]